jgi:hypothetical protein
MLKSFKYGLLLASSLLIIPPALADTSADLAAKKQQVIDLARQAIKQISIGLLNINIQLTDPKADQKKLLADQEKLMGLAEKVEKIVTQPKYQQVDCTAEDLKMIKTFKEQEAVKGTSALSDSQRKIARKSTEVTQKFCRS